MPEIVVNKPKCRWGVILPTGGRKTVYHLCGACGYYEVMTNSEVKPKCKCKTIVFKPHKPEVMK